MPLGIGEHPPLYKDWLVASIINKAGRICASTMFSLSFLIAAWLRPWRCQMIFGIPDVARIITVKMVNGFEW